VPGAVWASGGRIAGNAYVEQVRCKPVTSLGLFYATYRKKYITSLTFVEIQIINMPSGDTTEW
jgi:hypothetical protein